MVFGVLTILAVISGIYCCDLPSFINSSLFVNDHNSILYGIGQSIIASYIFFLIQVVIVDKIRLHKCKDAAYYEISGIKSNMESISKLLCGERDIKEYEKDRIKDRLENINFFEYGSGMDFNLKEMTIIEALIYNLEEIDKRIISKNIKEENKKIEKRIQQYKNNNYKIGVVTSNDKRISQRFITGKILHLDGDRKYSEKSYQYYRKLGLDAVVKNIPEYKQSKVVYELLNKYNPDILVITGHDGMIKRGTNYNDIYNYRNSRHFINTVKEARRYDLEKGKKTVIFAGACQSYFEAIITAGANFASSPARILIDFLDPLIVAEKVATTSEYKYINIEDIVKELRDGKKGVGGVGSNGRMKYIVT